MLYREGEDVTIYANEHRAEPDDCSASASRARQHVSVDSHQNINWLGLRSYIRLHWIDLHSFALVVAAFVMMMIMCLCCFVDATELVLEPNTGACCGTDISSSNSTSYHTKKKKQLRAEDTQDTRGSEWEGRGQRRENSSPVWKNLVRIQKDFWKISDRILKNFKGILTEFCKNLLRISMVKFKLNFKRLYTRWM